MSNRITIECHACGREFSKLIPKDERKGEHLTSCPFCKVESKIVFDALDVIEVFKSSKRLQTAIDEVKRGEIVKYDSVEDMMKDLKE